MRPRTLLFDWDNTLVDSWQTIHEALCVTFTALGLEPWSLAQTKSRVARSLRDTFPSLFGPRWNEALKLYVDSFTAIHLDRLKPLAGAGQALAELTAAGFALGVVSNKTGDLLRAEAAHLGWTGYFHRLVGAGDAAQDKPAAAPILMALEGSGFGCADAWYVGDTALDMECAGQAGCVGVLIHPSPIEMAGFADHPPDLHFPDCRALSYHVRGL
jgi:phosphoglycolate phosphatase